MKQERSILKQYFKTGDRPTQAQFQELIDSYAHLNEFNFGLSVKASGQYENAHYHFYIADDIPNSGAGHIIIIAKPGDKHETVKFYNHLFSQTVLYRTLDITLEGGLDIKTYEPKIIIERYKQKKRLRSGYVRPAGYYKENTWDAEMWGRSSEYSMTGHHMLLDINPIQYFRPTDEKYYNLVPSGSFSRNGSFKFSRHNKPFVPIRLKVQVNINGVNYTSRPVDTKIVLGTSSESDVINYIFH